MPEGYSLWTKVKNPSAQSHSYVVYWSEDQDEVMRYGVFLSSIKNEHYMFWVIDKEDRMTYIQNPIQQELEKWQ